MVNSVSKFMSHAHASLESILCTEKLNQRPTRLPDFEGESVALKSLAMALADSPDTILMSLADTILATCRCESAGISLLTDDEAEFYWPAIAGMWKSHVGGGTPRNFGPCGDVLDRNCPLLFEHIERRYTYLQPVVPSVEECLLVPFYLHGRAVGTIWAVIHDQRPDAQKFDQEDLRMLESLSVFAGAAYQAVVQSDALAAQSQERDDHEQSMQDMNEALLVSSVRQHELVEQSQKAESESLRHATELEDADRQKNEFLAMLAHELRNPLAPIRNALHILRLSREADDVERFISTSEMMEGQITHLVRLVDDLLDVSRITRGKIELRKERVELTSVLDQVVSAISATIDSNEHELSISLPERPIYLRADPTRLAQLVGNLLNNACKFTDKGGQLSLTAEREGDHAVIRVRDNGLGIASDELSRIFEMFVQVDSSLERSVSGLGIGLMLVKYLVELHDGTVEVQSEGLGRGSEFVVRLPIMADESESAAMAAPVPDEFTIHPLRILVVDDNRDSAKTMSLLLKLIGNETRVAFDGLEALDVAAEFRPDLAFLDIGLPKLSGYEVARRIREQPWGNNMVLVALTGWGQDEDRRKSQEAGCDFHLVKPVEHADMKLFLAGLPTPTQL